MCGDVRLDRLENFRFAFFGKDDDAERSRRMLFEMSRCGFRDCRRQVLFDDCLNRFRFAGVWRGKHLNPPVVEIPVGKIDEQGMTVQKIERKAGTLGAFVEGIGKNVLEVRRGKGGSGCRVENLGKLWRRQIGVANQERLSGAKDRGQGLERCRRVGVEAYRDVEGRFPG